MSAIEKLDLEIECSEADFGMMGWRIYREEPFAGSTEDDFLIEFLCIRLQGEFYKQWFLVELNITSMHILLVVMLLFP